jgi:eukaryotic-like serine/threonine-protein kinase
MESIGPYRILAKIGQGGMGEVYRARDTRLDRDVAVKVLPDAVATDPDRIMRFEREAKALAALNHPNIAHIYGVEQAGAVRALVMELVEGDTLDETITRGPIPLDLALPIARQVAEALEAAHDAAIVHRDLKPANIKVRDDGTVKVLDFGLAKALGPAPASDPHALVHSPTFTSPRMTELGVILGTARYMAPEQARGRAVDRRADIWAFGCVLFEMLAGRACFDGETATDVLAAIVTRDPDWDALPPDVPPHVRTLLARCLTRDPRQRLRDIGEARVLLSTTTGSASASGVTLAPLATATTPATTSTTTTTRRPAGLRAAIGLLLLATGALAGAGLAWWLARGDDTSATGSAGAFTLRRLTELPGAEWQPHISPDGRQVIFASAATGNYDIYLLRVGGARAINLTADSPAHDQQAVFSPDGERILFRSERDGGGIFLMGATGESVRRVTSAGFDPAWSPDGRSLVYSTEAVFDPYARRAQAALFTVDIESGRTTQLTETDAVQPAWSPDGSRIAYWANAGGQRDIWTVDAGGGTPVAVTADAATDWSPEWSPDGRWLYFSSDRGGSMNIWRVPIDQRTGVASGPPQAVTNSLSGVGYARFARDGRRLAVAAYTMNRELALVPFDPVAGTPPGESAFVRSPSLGWCSPSPDADWLACTSRGAQEDIVLMRPNGSEIVRLTEDPAKDRNPRWSPDGSRIGFMSSRSGEWELWSMRRDGADLRQVTALGADVYEAIWSPDGRRALTTSTTRAPFGTWLFDDGAIATPENATFVPNPPDVRFSADAWSPDGRFVAGSVLDAGGVPQRPAVWDTATNDVRAIDVPSPASTFDFVVAGWLPDSRRFVAASGEGLVVIDARAGTWTPVRVPRGATRFRLTADGRRLMMEREVLDADVWLLEAH